MLHGQDVNFLGDVFRPPDHSPFAKSFYFVRTACGITLNRVATLKGIFGECIEDAQQPLALAFWKRGENGQHRVIDGLVVAHNYFPSEESLS
jgi:hypothetical protein